MRSSNSKPGRSVSICDESYPNGPCSKKEGETDKRVGEGCRVGIENEIDNENDCTAEEQIRAVASKVVEEIVRLASATANERRAENLASPTASTSTHYFDYNAPTPKENHIHKVENESTNSKAERLKRLPTIQIDTVPSIPSSPTEWQAPSKNEAIAEEEEEEAILDAEQVQISSNSSASKNSEVKDLASAYVGDIVTKAMELAEIKQKEEETENAKEIASKVVEDILTQANEKAFEKLKDGLSFPENVPFIQIDTVPSPPPSPPLEEEVEQNYAQKEPIKRKKYRLILRQDDDDDDDTKVDEVQAKVQTTVRNLVKYSEAPVEIKEFASSYVREIISKAITMAEEKIVSSVPFNFEDVDLIKASGPWYIRARETFLRILRSACFCTPRRHDS